VVSRWLAALALARSARSEATVTRVLDGAQDSRAVMAARFGFAEDTVRLAAALRPALGSRGVPEHVYVDYADPPVMPMKHRDWCRARASRSTVPA